MSLNNTLWGPSWNITSSQMKRVYLRVSLDTEMKEKIQAAEAAEHFDEDGGRGCGVTSQYSREIALVIEGLPLWRVYELIAADLAETDEHGNITLVTHVSEEKTHYLKGSSGRLYPGQQGKTVVLGDRGFL